MNIEDVTNEDIVLSLIKMATEYDGGTDNKGIRGKKALQKSLYFLNEKCHHFSFRWGDYGPLSGEIQQIAEDLITRGYIFVREIKTKKEGAVIQNMEYSPVKNSYFEGLTMPEPLKTELNEIVKFIASKNPRDMELLASVHYWAIREQELLDEYSVDYIFGKLTDLKPDAGFKKSDVERAIETLVINEYLTEN